MKIQFLALQMWLFPFYRGCKLNCGNYLASSLRFDLIQTNLMISHGSSLPPVLQLCTAFLIKWDLAPIVRKSDVSCGWNIGNSLTNFNTRGNIMKRVGKSSVSILVALILQKQTVISSYVVTLPLKYAAIFACN